MEPKARFATLDGLRGIAAIAVVFFHIPEMFCVSVRPSCALAVDLFFLLSGFVVEHAYGDVLRGSQPFWQFVRHRMIRLYPLYVIGLVIYAAFCLARPGYTVWQVITSSGFALFYLPTPASLSFDPKFWFPVNPVSWSLFCEVLVNVAYGLFFYRASAVWLVGTAAIGAGLLVALRLGWGDHSEMAASWVFLADGILRATFSFLAGVLLRRKLSHRVHAGSLLAIVAVVLIFAINPKNDWRQVYGFLVVFAGFPLLLSFAAFSDDGNPRLRAIYDKLGLISYPAYVIHMPIVLWVAAVFPRLTGRQLVDFAPWSGLALLTFILGIAYLLARFYDEPVRRWMRHRIETRPHPASEVFYKAGFIIEEAIRMNSTWQIRKPFLSGAPMQYRIKVRDTELLIEADENGFFDAGQLPREIPLGIFAKPIYERNLVMFKTKKSSKFGLLFSLVRRTFNRIKSPILR